MAKFTSGRHLEPGERDPVLYPAPQGAAFTYDTSASNADAYVLSTRRRPAAAQWSKQTSRKGGAPRAAGPGSRAAAESPGPGCYDTARIAFASVRGGTMPRGARCGPRGARFPRARPAGRRKRGPRGPPAQAEAARLLDGSAELELPRRRRAPAPGARGAQDLRRSRDGLRQAAVDLCAPPGGDDGQEVCARRQPCAGQGADRRALQRQSELRARRAAPDRSRSTFSKGKVVRRCAPVSSTRTPGPKVRRGLHVRSMGPAPAGWAARRLVAGRSARGARRLARGRIVGSRRRTWPRGRAAAHDPEPARAASGKRQGENPAPPSRARKKSAGRVAAARRREPRGSPRRDERAPGADRDEGPALEAGAPRAGPAPGDVADLRAPVDDRGRPGPPAGIPQPPAESHRPRQQRPERGAAKTKKKKKEEARRVGERDVLKILESDRSPCGRA